MFKLTYDVYYMTRMLKDKVLSSIYDYYYDEYHTVKRMEPHQGGIITNLYNLTYEPTQILDRIYLGNAYNASNFIDLKMRSLSGFSSRIHIIKTDNSKFSSFRNSLWCYDIP